MKQSVPGKNQNGPSGQRSSECLGCRRGIEVPWSEIVLPTPGTFELKGKKMSSQGPSRVVNLTDDQRGADGQRELDDQREVDDQREPDTQREADDQREVYEQRRADGQKEADVLPGNDSSSHYSSPKVDLPATHQETLILLQNLDMGYCEPYMQTLAYALALHDAEIVAEEAKKREELMRCDSNPELPWETLLLPQPLDLPETKASGFVQSKENEVQGETDDVCFCDFCTCGNQISCTCGSREVLNSITPSE